MPKFILLTIILFIDVGLAQVNMEYLRKKLETDQTAGTVSFNFTIREGNSKYWKLEAEIAGGIKTFGGQLIGTGKKSDLIVNKETTDSKSFYHIRFIKDFLPQFTNEFFFQMQDNHSSRLQLRTLAGIGLRKSLLKNDISTVNLGTGFMSEVEKLTNENQSQLIRSTNYLSLNSNPTKKLKCTAVVYFQPALDNMNDFRLLFDFRPSLAITEHFTFSHKTMLRYDAFPPDNVEKLDYELAQMIEYRF